jgi:hypothetical protein
MRVIRRNYLAPLLLIAALAFALATHLAPATSPIGGSLAGCPLGTNWDAAAGTCQ